MLAGTLMTAAMVLFLAAPVEPVGGESEFTPDLGVKWDWHSAPVEVASLLHHSQADRETAERYLDALAEFNSELAERLPTAERVKRLEKSKRRNDRFLKLLERLGDDPASVKPAEIDAVLELFADGMTKLDHAQQRDGPVLLCSFRPDADIQATEMPYLAASRQAARVLTLQIRRGVERGRLDAALKSFERLLQLSRDLQHSGGTLTLLISLALDAVAFNDGCPAILASPNLEAGHYRRLLALLREHDQVRAAAYARSIKAEYIWSRNLLYDIQHREGDFGAAAEDGKTFGTALAEFVTDDPQERMKLAARIDRMTASDFEQEIEALDAAVRLLVAEADASAARRVKTAEKVRARFERDTVISWYFALSTCPQVAILLERQQIRIDRAIDQAEDKLRTLTDHRAK